MGSDDCSLLRSHVSNCVDGGDDDDATSSAEVLFVWE